ncbi:pregnancy-specific beta-1-glycoprotein 11-like [Gigantopelta aegis]|uniref:pregnancy-specific beta-1-glycoprotein 11-like n=1 Tax=Gigantopelta aegis TaxID=1735272 RepID=UPI001B88865E|nr:pregnancy-specific beta-1-glycoprotein 11-like [Gigantopelta aegis]
MMRNSCLLLVCLSLLSSSDVSYGSAPYSLSGSADHADVDSHFTFTCDAGSKTGSGGMTWVAARVPFAMSQGPGTSCVNVDDPTEYEYSCSEETIFNITIPSVSFSKHGSRWSCAGEYGGTPSIVMTLEVYVPLTNTTMAIRPTSIVSGVITVLQCSTNPCYPNAAIIWTQNNINITTGVTTDTEYIADSGVITRSNLTRSYTRADHGQQIVCAATSDGTTKSSSPLQLVIWDGPVAGSINFNSTATIPEGDDLTVDCAVDCNPPCDYAWTLGDNQITTSPLLNLTDISRNQDGNVYNCTVTNSAISKSTHKKFTLKVSYPERMSALSAGVISGIVIAVVLALAIPTVWILYKR